MASKKHRQLPIPLGMTGQKNLSISLGIAAFVKLKHIINIIKEDNVNEILTFGTFSIEKEGTNKLLENIFIKASQYKLNINLMKNFLVEKCEQHDFYNKRIICYEEILESLSSDTSDNISTNIFFRFYNNNDEIIEKITEKCIKIGIDKCKIGYNLGINLN